MISRFARAGFTALAAMLLALSACAPQPGEAPFESADPLAFFFTALDQASTEDPVVILQLGDSHSAGDNLDEALAALFHERFGRNIHYEAHGVVGATSAILDQWRDQGAPASSAARDPDLIIVAFGTNEGFDDALDPALYREDFRRRLAHLRSSAPEAALLVIGPPDAQRRRRDCGAIAADQCAPLTAAERSDYSRLIAGAPDAQSCRWHDPPNLDPVRQAQREAAVAANAEFWDWSQVMGACGAHRWANYASPLAWGDHVHLRPEGYARSAEALFTDLMNRRDAPGAPRAP